MNKLIVVLVPVVVAAMLPAVLASNSEPVSDETRRAPPLYRSSVVGTTIDFITDSDPSVFERLDYIGFMPFEMPDKRGTGEPLIQEAYVFDAYFGDRTTVRLALDRDFATRQAAEQDAMRYAPRIGKLPSLYRQKLKHIVVHYGGVDTTAFAEDKGHFFTIYSDNATKRINTHDLEETLFHESTHATIQSEYINQSSWKDAKHLDQSFITEYAKTEDQEDFAESALFAYTLIRNPERFTEKDFKQIRSQIPNRIEFFRKIYGDVARD